MQSRRGDQGDFAGPTVVVGAQQPGRCADSWWKAGGSEEMLPISSSASARVAELEARCRELERTLVAKDAERREAEDRAVQTARELERRERQVDELALHGQTLSSMLSRSDVGTQQPDGTAQQAARLDIAAEAAGHVAHGAAASVATAVGGAAEYGQDRMQRFAVGRSRLQQGRFEALPP